MLGRLDKSSQLCDAQYNLLMNANDNLIKRIASYLYIWDQESQGIGSQAAKICQRLETRNQENQDTKNSPSAGDTGDEVPASLCSSLT